MFWEHYCANTWEIERNFHKIYGKIYNRRFRFDLYDTDIVCSAAITTYNIAADVSVNKNIIIKIAQY